MNEMSNRGERVNEDLISPVIARRSKFGRLFSYVRSFLSAKYYKGKSVCVWPHIENLRVATLIY